MEIYDNNSKLDDAKLKYVLTQNTAEYLSQSNDVVNKFISILRERHDLINKVIQNCVTGDQKSCVASLLTNNFYENVFSSSFIENELLIVLYLSLKNEISGLTQQNIPQAFLKESFNSFLFRGLLRKDDVKSYFGIVLKDVIEEVGVERVRDLKITHSNAPLISATIASTAARDASPKFSAPNFA